MTIFSVMRRPRWIAALILALAIAAGFAALGRWQLERAVSSTDQQGTRNSEVVLPLNQVALPQQPVYQQQEGQLVTVTGNLATRDFRIISQRFNGGTEGYWVIGRLRVTDLSSTAPETSLAVAVGWTADRKTAESVAQQLNGADASSSREWVGRYLGTEAPEIDDARRAGTGAAGYQMTTMSVAALINLWQDVPHDADVYGGYLVASDPLAGLIAIDSPTPEHTTQLNWLNIFYAVEWTIFAGFALFFWYRMVRDAWEREAETAQKVASGSPGRL